MPSFCPSVREDETQRGTHAASQGSRTHGIRIRHRRQQSPQRGQTLHLREDVRREGKVQDRRLSALEGQRANAIIIWKPSEQAVVWNKRSMKVCFFREVRIRVESPHVSEGRFQPERRRADTDTGRKTPRQAEACRGEGFSARLMDDAH